MRGLRRGVRTGRRGGTRVCGGTRVRGRIRVRVRVRGVAALLGGGAISRAAAGAKVREADSGAAGDEHLI
jgi:hypothetical protein